MGKRKNTPSVGAPTSKTRKLMLNPVIIPSREFENNVVEEMTNCDLMLINKEGVPLVHNWTKENGKAHMQFKASYSNLREIAKPSRTKLKGKKVIEPSDDDEEDEYTKKMEDKKKNRKHNQKPKVSYDKSTNALLKIQQNKENGEDETTEPLMDVPVKQCVDVGAWAKYNLPEPLNNALSELGFSRPTKIQALSLGPALTSRSDILGAAETGSGKTLAFGIPIVAGLYRENEKAKQDTTKMEKNAALRQKTMEAKERRKKISVYSSDEEEEIEESSDSENDQDEDSEFEEASDNDVEEYLFNGADGITEVTYDQLGKKQRNTKYDSNKKSKKEASNKNKSKSNDESENDEDSDDAEEGDIDSDFEDDMVEEDIGEGEEEDMGEDEDLGEGEKENGFSSDDEDLQVNSGDDGDMDEPADCSFLEYNSDEDNKIDDQEELSDEEGDLDDEEDSDCNSGDEKDRKDLGSDDEEEMSDRETKSGLVRVINNVQFPFLEGGAVNTEVVDDGKPKLRALIMTPTRELAVQIHQHLSELCRHCSVTCGVVVGGLDARKQKRVMMRTRPQILVATPGRLWELIQDGLEHVKALNTIRYLAIDEADRLLDGKNFEELHKIINLMNQGASKKDRALRQTFVFSATLTMIHKLPDRITSSRPKTKMTSANKLQKLAKMVGTKPSAKIIDVTRQHATAENLTEAKINCTNEDKDMYLYYFLCRHPGRTMVFCNSIDCVRRLVSLFKVLRFTPHELHASMHQKQRLSSLQSFVNSPRGLLITSDVAARGLDIDNVKHIIHYQVPFTAEIYVHRSGRTARGSQAGISVAFVDPKTAMKFKQICATLNRQRGQDIPLFPVDENLYDQVIERVDMARKIERLEFKTRNNERDRTDAAHMAKEAGLEIEEDVIDQEDLYLMNANARQQYQFERGSSKSLKLEMKHLKRELDQMLDRPLIGAMFSFSHPTSKAAMANTLGTTESSVPDELVALNPQQTLGGNTAEELYKERYAQGLYGDVPEDQQATLGLDPCAMLRKQNKEISKLTKQLLKPQESQKEIAKRVKERTLAVKQKKAAKKREKRRKKKGINKGN